MTGLKVIVTACDKSGNVDLDDLRAKAAEAGDQLSCLMVTYPSTHGVYEETINEVCDIVHQHGGQVYIDGANMNAQVGLTAPGFIGADFSHLNLHKTFAIPHGGGGLGMGSIGLKKHLAPFGSVNTPPISWMYIVMLGDDVLKKSTQVAILNVNYLAKKLGESFTVLFRTQWSGGPRVPFWISASSSRPQASARWTWPSG